MKKEEIAKALFAEGCNCCQAVFCAFCEDFSIDKETAAQIALPFGGGMGVGSTCGALTGALMAMGLAHGKSLPPQPEDKAACRQDANMFAKAFKEKFGTTQCREILASPEGNNKKICPDLVAFMAAYTEAHLAR